MQIEHDLKYYSRPDGVRIAYSTAGSGEPLLVVPGWTTHLSYFWTDPASLLFGPLTDHVELIMYDKHGSGLSDRDRTEFTLETERYDVEALADHLGLEKFNLFGMSEGGTVAADYAAHHPERINKLVLYSTTANGTELAPREFAESVVSLVRASWGVGAKVMADMLMPNATKEQLEEFAQYQRDASSADFAADTLEMLYSWDIRDELPSISAPTLIIHRKGSRAFPPSNGRDLAAGIPDSKAIIVGGRAHFPPEPGDPYTIDVINAILSFVAEGATAVAVRDRANIHTVMFTDIVSSSEIFARRGDDEARAIIREHDKLIEEVSATHGGRLIKSMGDGLMLTFGSASGALDAALEIQQGFSGDHNALSSVKVRIGIDAGEPIDEADDLHGTSVIRAARIMGEADGGQVLTSGIVRELVAGKLYRFANRGNRQLKGITEPTRIFELLNETEQG